MPCFSPMPAWRSAAGVVSLREPLDSQVVPSPYVYMRLPCGNCIGCRRSRAREWAFRCMLELQDHEHACWVTLTYNDEHLPSTLRKDHLSGYLKRLRARVHPRQVRFFGSGEYGERNGRAHYHCILFGLPRDEPAITASWAFGFSRTDPLSPAAVSYVAGYTSKKVGRQSAHLQPIVEEVVDPDTGEVLEEIRYQPPFVLMSRRPGIGGSARKFWRSWRSFALHNGNKIPVPRFLHQAWLSNTSPSDHEVLAIEKSQLPSLDSSPERLRAAALIALSRQSSSSSRRHL